MRNAANTGLDRRCLPAIPWPPGKTRGGSGEWPREQSFHDVLNISWIHLDDGVLSYSKLDSPVHLNQLSGVCKARGRMNWPNFPDSPQSSTSQAGCLPAKGAPIAGQAQTSEVGRTPHPEIRVHCQGYPRGDQRIQRSPNKGMHSPQRRRDKPKFLDQHSLNGELAGICSGKSKG